MYKTKLLWNHPIPLGCVQHIMMAIGWKTIVWMANETLQYVAK